MMMITTDLNLIYAISFMDLFAIGLTFPLLGPYLRSIGTSHSTIGVLSACYYGIQIVSGPIVGSWSDIAGRRYVFTITLIFSSILYVFLGCVNSIPGFFLVRILLGVFKHTQTLVKAVAVDLVPKDKLPQVFGKSAALSTLGFVFGPIIGGHVSELNNGFSYVCFITASVFALNIGPIIGGHVSELNNGFSYVCFITASLFALNIVFLYRMTSTTKQQLKTTKIFSEVTKSFEDLTRVNWTVFQHPFLLRFIFGMTTTMYFMNQSLILTERYEMSKVQVGYCISFVSIVGAVCGFQFANISRVFYMNDRNYMKRITHGFILFILCFVGFLLAPSYVMYLVILVPFGVANSALRIVTMECILDKTGTNDRGCISGATNSIMSVGRFISPLIAGVMSDTIGLNGIFLSALGFAVIGAKMAVALDV